MAAFGLDEPGDHVERGGLAGAVWSEQADRLAAPDVKADLIHHHPSAVTLGETMRGQITIRARLPPRRLLAPQA